MRLGDPAAGNAYLFAESISLDALHTLSLLLLFPLWGHLTSHHLIHHFQRYSGSLTDVAVVILRSLE